MVMKKKSKGYRAGGKMKSKGYRAGGKMKTKMMRKGGKASGMTVAKLRSEAKKKGYKLVKSYWITYKATFHILNVGCVVSIPIITKLIMESFYMLWQSLLPRCRIDV